MVEGSSLENWRGCKLTVGSNPTLTAIKKAALFIKGPFFNAFTGALNGAIPI